MIVDVNVLLYATNGEAPQHDHARMWWQQQLNGSTRIGLPWPVLLAFLRVGTSPRILREPMTATEAWAFVQEWLGHDIVWIPNPTNRHAQVLAGFFQRYRITANLVPDAHLAALAYEHGVPIASADTDFARFEEIRWINPLAG